MMASLTAASSPYVTAEYRRRIGKMEMTMRERIKPTFTSRFKALIYGRGIDKRGSDIRVMG